VEYGESRSEPAYAKMKPPAEYAKNAHILSWWTEQHDAAIIGQIESKHWLWYWYASDAIVAVTDPQVIENWRKTDPLCSQYAWYNILMNFAAARADVNGMTSRMREPRWKECGQCRRSFREDSLPVPLVERQGADQIDFCGSCMRRVAYEGGGDPRMTRQQICDYVEDLATILQRVPSQGFGNGKWDMLDLPTPDRVRLLQLLRKQPTPEGIEKHFGSWLGALVAAGVLEGGARKTSRGIQSLAIDGHVCFSLGEKTIDDFLTRRQVPHDREPSYPEGQYRADFIVGGTFVEYLGLHGDPDYDAKTETKTAIACRHALDLILVVPEELITTARLEEVLRRVLPATRSRVTRACT